LIAECPAGCQPADRHPEDTAKVIKCERQQADSLLYNPQSAIRNPQSAIRTFLGPAFASARRVC
jgi:hypothetical protein